MINVLMRTVVAVALVLAAGAGASSAAFPERDITFLIPFSPGGGMDSTSRQVARLMPKYLPNEVNVIPKNVPGAGGRKGYGMLSKAAPDGYTISVINMPGAIIPQLTGAEVNFDVTRFVWIGRMSTSPYLLGVSGKSSIRTLDDIRNLGRPLKIAATGYGSTAYTGASVLRSVVGFPAQFITGYKGSKAYIVGVIRGDGDAAVAPTQTFNKYVMSGDIHGIVTFEETSSFAGVPTIAQAGYPELTGLGVERMVAATPGTPAEVARILSDALGKAIGDAESQAWAEKTKRPFSHLTGDQTQAAVDKALAIFRKYPDALQKQ